MNNKQHVMWPILPANVRTVLLFFIARVLLVLAILVRFFQY